MLIVVIVAGQAVIDIFGRLKVADENFPFERFAVLHTLDAHVEGELLAVPHVLPVDGNILLYIILPLYQWQS